MKVQKRDGSFEEIKFEKIQKRIKDLSKGLNIEIDKIAQKAIERLNDGIKTDAIDNYVALMAVSHNVHPHYSVLAGRFCISSLHKNTSVGMVQDSEKDKFAKILKSEKLDENNKIIKKIRASLYEDPKREEILSRYLEGKKVSDKDIDFLTRTPRFLKYIKILVDQGTLHEDMLKIISANREKIENYLDYQRDYNFDFFGYKTLEKSYLLKEFKSIMVTEDELDDNDQPTGRTHTKSKVIGTIIERPQDLFMRVAIGIMGDQIDDALKLYDMMSNGLYTHATPTLFNAGTKRPQMSSCFLLDNKSDSIEGIFETFTEEALISKNAGGIGVAYHNVRSRGSVIKGTNGVSNGIVPFLQIKNAIARGIDQGGGKRKGSFAVYLEPWHADIKEFIQLRRKTGSEESRARDLFLALWIPNLFWERVVADEKWTLFDPATAKGLHLVHGEEFNALYKKYEEEGLAVEVLSARELLLDIFEVQTETGVPYMLNKDEANRKSNQQNLGTIKSSNLCTEIIEYTDAENSAVCNLSSTCLPKFVRPDRTFNFKALHDVIKFQTYTTDRVIDANYYVNDKTRNSNMRNRPIGLGVQGLADVFFKMRISYTSKEAQQLNEEIFETIYHAAVEASVEMAKKLGHYESMTFNGGAPITKGKLQFDLWEREPASVKYKTNRYDWEALRKDVQKYGMRNSLLIAPMPTASTSQIFGNTESFEPLTENIYRRKTLAGEFTVVNRYLIEHLEELGLWSKSVLDHIILNQGSVATCTDIPQEIREIYKTVWELKMKPQLDMAADRGAYICQSQSFNLHINNPTMEMMKDIYLYSHKLGLKTMSYYLKTNSAGSAQKVTVEKKAVLEEQTNPNNEIDDCEVCSS